MAAGLFGGLEQLQGFFSWLVLTCWQGQGGRMKMNCRLQSRSPLAVPSGYRIEGDDDYQFGCCMASLYAVAWACGDLGTCNSLSYMAAYVCGLCGDLGRPLWRPGCGGLGPLHVQLFSWLMLAHTGGRHSHSEKRCGCQVAGTKSMLAMPTMIMNE